jgi:coatomer subunit alpha
MTFEPEGGQYLLMQFDKDLTKCRCINERRGAALTAFFISKDRLCYLDTNREVVVSSFDGSNTKKWPIMRKNLSKVEKIFPGPLGKILVFADDCLFLYDLSARKVVHEIQMTDVKRVYWTPQYSHAAVITKNSINILNKSLQIVNSQKETSKIKSGIFDELNSFVYSTATHIKYMFLEGKTTGTFRSIDQPVYLTFFLRNQIYALTRQGEVEVFPVDNTDYLFKIALHNRNLQEVKDILYKGQLCGRSIVYYLKEQGYSEIALFFEQDVRQRFDLALSCGNLQVGLETAKQLKEKDLFLKLAQTALALGNYEIPEKCYQLNREFDKLNFFYATTGSQDKLHKMS